MMDKVKVSKVFYSLVISTLTFTVFFRALLQAVLGEIYNSVYLLILVSSWISFLLGCKKISKKSFTQNIPWLLLCVIFVVHPYKSASLFSYTNIVTIGSILLCLILSTTAIEWKKYVMNSMLLWCMVHAIFTIIFGFFPALYSSTVLNLFSGDVHAELVGEISAGCVPGLTGHYSANGIYLSIGVMICFFNYWLNNSTKRIKNKTGIKLLILGLALLLTGKRAQLVFVIFAIAATWFIVSPEKFSNKASKIFMGSISVAVIGILILNFVPALSFTLTRIKAMFDATDITNGRLYFYEYAIKWFKESPIWGIGWDGFRYRLYETRGSYLGRFTYMSAHNVYLQILCELGLVGYCIFIIKLFADLSKTIKLSRLMKRFGIYGNEDFKSLVFAIAFIIYFMLYCITGNPLYDLEFFFPYMIAIAGAYATARNV